MMFVLLLILHVLLAAGWFGAMGYSLWVMQPKAARFFGRSEDFEQFVATIADGARWPVLGCLGLIAASGIGSWILAGAEPTEWTVLIGVKLGLLIAALAIFAFTSWRLWPARVLAGPGEAPRFQRRFRWVGWALIVIAAASIVLGIVARQVREAAHSSRESPAAMMPRR